MAMEKPLILYPIRFTSTSYVIRVNSNSSAQNLPFPATGSLTVGRNYWMSGDGQADSDGGVGGVGDLVTMLDTAIDAHTQTNVSCSLLAGSFNVVATFFPSNAAEIMWAHGSTTLDPTLFGWTASNTGVQNSLTSTNAPRGIWNPAQPPSTDTRERQPVTVAVGTSISGLQRVSRLAAPTKTRDLGWRLLPKEKALTEYVPTTDPFGSFEYLFVNALSHGYPIRYYPDRSDLTSDAYTLYVPRELNPDEDLKVDSAPLRWQASLKLRRTS